VPTKAGALGRWSTLALIATLASVMGAVGAPRNVLIASPDGRLSLTVMTTGGELEYRVTFDKATVIETSRLGIVIDGINLGHGVELGQVEHEEANETYAWRGVHSVAVDRYDGAKISCKSSGGGDFTVEVRAFNDGVAFRFIVPRDSTARVPDAAISFVLPPESTVWYYGLSHHYEGVYKKRNIADAPAGDWAAPPVTFQLPGGAGYASITEAALVNYSGMALQADGHNGFQERLGDEEPLSYDFLHVHRDAVEVGKRLSKPAAINGTIVTPWRVVLVGQDLNTLVNADVIQDLNPPPDKDLFPEGFNTTWLKPGRSVWRFMDGGGIALEDMKEFSRQAGELGFEYNLGEHWQRWSDAQIRELVDYSNRYNVRIMFWLHSQELMDPVKRRSTFERLHDLGVAGVKVDFVDNEAKELIDFYNSCLRDAAELELVVIFHGADKPTGESRTWPNELTREAIYGLEQATMPAWAEHNTTLPFTRFLAGPADYTPVIFGDRRRDTSWAHQIATAGVFTSPLMVYAANPKNILQNPAVGMIKSMPSVWDQTVVLPMSRIGEIAAFARRSGDTWFLAILNGPQTRDMRVGLSFLGKGRYQAMLVEDVQDNPAAVKIQQATVGAENSVKISLRPSGGFIARFSR